MADEASEKVFGKPGSALESAWWDYYLARTPEERARAQVRIWSIQRLNDQLSDPRRLVYICGI